MFVIVCYCGWLLFVWCVCFFCFKQKTAYELRISDWSSDVCSSDLGFGGVHDGLAVGADAHALGLDADRNLRDGGTALEVYHGHQVVVLVGGVESLAVR